MGRRKEITARDLARATPRQLEEWADERGIEIPLRADSSIVRQAIWNHEKQKGRGSNAITTDDIPDPVAGQAVAAAADPAKAVSPLPATEEQAEGQETEAQASEESAPAEEQSYDDLTVADLKDLADKRDVEVKGKQGKRPTKPDYVKALNADDKE